MAINRDKWGQISVSFQIISRTGHRVRIFFLCGLMYSLYRAWLGFGPMGPLPGPFPSGSASLGPPQGVPGPPDVSLQVGPTMTHFSAHRSILGAHSGFFKAALANHAGPSPIAVPTVNVDEFSCLLTFMYTGYLDLNLTNIYNILLATHILHMPRALEICRSFLLQTQPLETRPNIIKPIPNRKTALPYPQILPPTTSNLKKSEATPFKVVREKSDEEPKPPVEEQKAKKTATKPRKRESKERAIVDIACCDGPVRFHRVINKNYGLQVSENDYTFQEVNRNEAMNKAMSENIRDKQRSDENQSSSDLFTCLYCNHTFKSQYCYQKHARRHLNPVSLDGDTSSKREVKILDMNVQYYPCKTCGSKFPSYYFVHKHRKMCHAEEIQDKGEERVESCESSKESAIDVE